VSTRDPKRELLARLIGEAKNESIPEVGWDDAEERLRERLSAERPARRASSLPLGGLVLAAAAAFGAAALFVAREGHPPNPPAPVIAEVSAPAVDRHHLDGDALSQGAKVASDDRPVVVEHAGRATWTLAPNSVLHVESLGSVIQLALDSGSVSAHVVKSPKPESFVVRVERTRVAVHGTRFNVERTGDSVHVAVAEGVVAVGPVGGKSFEVRAPGAATLSLDGVRTDEHVTRTRRVVKATGEAPKPAQEPETDGGDRVAESVDGIVAGVRSCFAENTFSRGDLKVSVQTRMSLRVLASGHVEEVDFTPPLAPAVTRCVDAMLSTSTFPATQNDFVVERLLGLDR